MPDPQSDLGPFLGALSADGAARLEAVPAALAAALAAAARPGEALAATPAADGAAALVPWRADAERSVVRHAAPLGAPRADLTAVAAAARALADLHARGRAHGDLRPGALRDDGAGAPALAVPEAPVDAGALLGARLRAGLATPEEVAYAAPEVARGEAGGAAADAYGLCALAYRALTGQAPLGQVEVPHGPGVPEALALAVRRGLNARADRRPALPALSEALAAAAATPAAPAAAAGAAAAGAAAAAPAAAADGVDADFVLLDAAPTPATGSPTRAPTAPPRAEGAQVSAILVLVLGLGGLFVLVGAIGLALVLGGPGIFMLLALLTAGAAWGGTVLERKGSPRGGLALLGIATQLLWADAAYLLDAVGLLGSSLAWAVVGAGVAGATGWLARQRRSGALWVLAGLGSLVACACLWSAVGPGGRALLLAVASGGLLFGGHAARQGGRETEGLALLHAGALGLLAVAAQVLNLTDRLDDALAWSAATGAAAVATGLLAARLAVPGLWLVAGLDAALSFGCLWAGLQATGRGLLASAAAVALVGAGERLVALGRRPEGLGATVAGGLVAWVGAGHLLLGARLADSSGAWAVAAGALALATGVLAVRHGALALAVLAAVDLSAAAGSLGEWLSTGTRYGPVLYTGAVAAAFAGVAAGLHRAGGLALGGPFAAGAGLWTWASALAGLALLGHDRDPVGVAWPLLLSAVGTGVGLAGPQAYRWLAAAAAAPLLALVPTVIAFVHHDSVGHLQLALVAGFLGIAAAFWVPDRAATPTRQVLTILPGLVPVTVAPFVLCLVKCAGKDGLALLLEALSTLGKVHETAFAYLASVVGSSGVLVGLAFVFAPRAKSKVAYRLLEVAGLVLFFGTLTLLSFSRLVDWLYPLLLFGGGAVVIGLGASQRRAALVACAAPALVFNLWVQYFAKLGDVVPKFGLVLGFGLGLVAFGLFYERRVKRSLPTLRTWD